MYSRFSPILEYGIIMRSIISYFQCFLGEVPFLYVSSWIIEKLGHARSMSLALFAMAVRLILYSVISNPWWYLLIAISHGLTFGLYNACVVSYAGIIAPTGTEVTVQVSMKILPHNFVYSR